MYDWFNILHSSIELDEGQCVAVVIIYISVVLAQWNRLCGVKLCGYLSCKSYSLDS